MEYLAACRELAAEGLVLRFVDAGEMRLAVDPSAASHAGNAGDLAPSLWAERVDVAAWGDSIAGTGGRDRGGVAPDPELAHQLPYLDDG